MVLSGDVVEVFVLTHQDIDASVNRGTSNGRLRRRETVMARAPVHHLLGRQTEHRLASKSTANEVQTQGSGGAPIITADHGYALNLSVAV